MEEFETMSMAVYGFFIHGTPANDGEYMNFHTHGVPESFNHQDIQIVMPFDPGITAQVIHNIVDLIKNGNRFVNGSTSQDVLSEYRGKKQVVRFIDAVESGRQVLRVLIPDKNGFFPEDVECDPRFKKQIGVVT